MEFAFAHLVKELDMETRVDYHQIRNWVLEDLYTDQRDSLFENIDNFDKTMSLHSIATSFDGVFEHPVENLMLMVFFLILSPDCEANMREPFRRQVEKILNKNDLSNLLNSISDQERDNFTLDLKALGLLPVDLPSRTPPV